MKFSYQLRKDCFRKLNELSFSYFDKTPQGWIIARMTSDVGRLSEIVSWSMMDLFWGISLMIFTTVMMLSVNWKLALLVLMIVPFLAVVSVFFQTRILKSYREVRKINSKITSGFSEGIMGAKTIKSLAIEDKMEVYERSIASYEADIRRIQEAIKTVESKYTVLANFIKGAYDVGKIEKRDAAGDPVQ